MAKFKFKSSGINIETVKVNIDQQNNVIPFQPNIGLKTPLSLGRDGLFTMHNELIDQITDNLKNLILTNHGERLALYDFGANLRELLTEYNEETFNENATNRIIEAVNKWMPFVDLVDLSTEVEKNTINGVAVVAMKIVFNVTGLNENNRQLKVRLFVI